MKVRYIENEKTYLIANHGVAKNAIFRLAYFRKRLERKIYRYLSPLCEVREVAIHNDQFQVVVCMASREVFESYYINKRKEQGKEVGEIPASTYIFSQVMANLQSSVAIHFNRKEGRTGAVFARRFCKIRIDGAEELRVWLKKLREKVKLHRYTAKWSGVYWGSRVGIKKGDGRGLLSENLVKDKFSRGRLQGRSKNSLKITLNHLSGSLSPP